MTATFAADYLTTCIEREQVAGTAAETAYFAKGESILDAADDAGVTLDIIGIEWAAQQLVQFPAHVGHKMTYTRNAMRCLDCDCLATEGC